jgi:kinetochore protein NDC80
MDSGHPTLQYSELIPEKFEHPDHHSALAFDYFTEAYEIFCTGSDNFVDQQLKLEERYSEFPAHKDPVSLLISHSQEGRAD